MYNVHVIVHAALMDHSRIYFAQIHHIFWQSIIFTLDEDCGYWFKMFTISHNLFSFARFNLTLFSIIPNVAIMMLYCSLLVSMAAIWWETGKQGGKLLPDMQKSPNFQDQYFLICLTNFHKTQNKNA